MKWVLILLRSCSNILLVRRQGAPLTLASDFLFSGRADVREEVGAGHGRRQIRRVGQRRHLVAEERDTRALMTLQQKKKLKEESILLLNPNYEL